MPRVLEQNPDGTYTVQSDAGAIVKTAMLPPGLSAPGVLAVPGLSPPPAAPAPAPPVATDPFSQQMRSKLRADAGIPETMTPDELAAAGKRGGAAGAPAAGLVDYRPGMGGQRGGGPPAPGYAPARVIPGHMQLAAENIQETRVDPAAKEQLGKDYQAAGEAADAGTAAQVDAASKLGQAKGETNSDLDVLDAKNANHEQTRQQRLAEEQGTLARYQDELNSGGFVDKGIEKFGGRAVAGISAALSAAGDALAHTGGAFMQHLNRSMDRYIDEARDTAKGKVAGQQNLIGQLEKTYGSQRQAETAARLLMLDRADRQVDALVTQNSPQQIQANGEKVKAQIAIERDKLAADFTKQIVEKHEVMTKPVVVGGPPKSQEVENKLLVKDLSGNTFVADSQESAEKARANHGLVSQALDAAREMKEIANAGAGAKLDPTSPLGQKFAFAQERYTNAMNTLQGQGVVRGEDVERYQKYTGGQFGLSTAQMADTLAQKARLGYDSQVKAIADTDAPAKREWYRDPRTGEVRRRAVYDIDQAQRPAGPVNFTPAGGR